LILILVQDWLALNETFAQAQRELFETRQSGALTYTAPLLAPIPLQALTSPEHFTTLRHALDLSISQIEARGEIAPLRRIQYDVLRAALDGGEVGWLELVLVPSGGVLSPPVRGKSGATVVAIQLHPFGRGSVHINTTDPLASPLIDPNFLPEDLPWDAAVLVAGSKFVRKWFATEPVRALVERPLTPPEDLAPEAKDAKWDANAGAQLNFAPEDYKPPSGYVSLPKYAFLTSDLQTGTTAMAPRKIGGVVDPTLKVYGLANVRVVDASIIPLTVGVAIQPTVYAIAEKVLMYLGAGGRYDQL
ncbi:GMC oxidoreductase-domain-containing protein, partial [Amylostereum chailletii]